MSRDIVYILLICLSLFSCKKSIKDIIADTEDATFVVYTYNSIYNHRTTKTNQKYPSVNL